MIGAVVEDSGVKVWANDSSDGRLVETVFREDFPWSFCVSCGVGLHGFI